jgi:hypothetical protein
VALGRVADGLNSLTEGLSIHKITGGTLRNRKFHFTIDDVRQCPKGV